MSKEEMAKHQGVALYPGAESPPGQSTVIAGGADSRFALVLVSTDSPDKVVAFYKHQIPVLNGGGHGGGFEFRGRTADKSPVHLIIGSQDGKTKISLEVVAPNSLPKG